MPRLSSSSTTLLNIASGSSDTCCARLTTYNLDPQSKAFLLSALTILVYYFFSITLTFFNHYLFVTFKYPLSITVIHLVVKFIISSIIRSLMNFCNRHQPNKKRVTLDWGTYFRRIVPTGVASAVDIGFSNWSLQYITITLYTMSKSTVVLFIMFFAIILKLEKLRWSIALIVSCISFGLFLFTYHSTEFNLFGFVLIMIASFHSGLRWTLAQLVTQKHELGLSNPIDMIYHIQPGMIFCLLPLAVYVEGLSVVTTDKFFRTEEFHVLLTNSFYILLSAILAFFLEASEYLVVTYTSSLTLSISGIFKEICTIYLAIVINKNKINSMNSIGLIVCLLGIILHVVVKARQLKKHEEPSSIRSQRNSQAPLSPGRQKDDESKDSYRLTSLRSNSNKFIGNGDDIQHRPLLNDDDNDIN